MDSRIRRPLIDRSRLYLRLRSIWPVLLVFAAVYAAGFGTYAVLMWWRQ